MIDIDNQQQSMAREVMAHFNAGNLADALAVARQLTGKYPNFALGWYMMSRLYSRLNKFAEADAAIDSALNLKPTNKHALQKALCHFATGRRLAALELAESLLTERFTAASLHFDFGNLLNELNRVEDALVQFNIAIEMDPAPSAFYFNKACMQRYLGDIDGAYENFSEAIRRSPNDYEAYYSRSGLRPARSEQNTIAELTQVVQAAEASGRQVVDIHFLYFALAKEYEDLGRIEDASAALQKANGRRRSLMQYRVQTDVEIIHQIEQVFQPAVFAEPKQGYREAEPIFILGLPRTGTTLVERILASHSAVESAGEINDFSIALIEAVKTSGLPVNNRQDFIAASAHLDFESLGRRYMEKTTQYCPGSVHIIDKLPFNYLYVGLIKLALPNAKIINLRRHPLDTCLAIYKQYFKDAYPFSYDLADLGTYYLAYDALMRHWEKVVPYGFLRVDYEAVVADPEQQARQIVAYCGLQWEAGCLDFHTNSSASKTASATQVRRPVYADSVAKWRRYETLLAPLLAQFERAGLAL